MQFFHSTTVDKYSKMKEYQYIFCGKSMKEKKNIVDDDVSYDDRYGYNTYVYGRPVLHFDYGELCLELNVPTWMQVVNPLGNHIQWASLLTPNEIRSFLMPGNDFEAYWKKNKTQKLTLKDLQEIYKNQYHRLVQFNPLLREIGIDIAELMVPREVPLQYLKKIHFKDGNMNS